MFVLSQHVSVSPMLVGTQHISNVCSQSTRFSVTSACKNTTYFQRLYSANTFQCHQCLQRQHISNGCSQSTRFSVTGACKNNIFPMFVVSQHVSVSPVLVGTHHISNVCSQSTRFSVTSACKNNIFPMFVVPHARPITGNCYRRNQTLASILTT